MAFWDLDSERSFGMGLGPIPRSKILAYAVEMELDQEGESDLLFLIRAMDNWHLKSQNKTDGG